MRNPNPIKRAWRLEKRRKYLGSNNPSCLDCGEPNMFCLELDHPVTEDIDNEFKRVKCRNCHRKVEFKRDERSLTHNGRRGVRETKRQQERRYLLLNALDLEGLSELVLDERVSRERIAAELRATVGSLRRRAKIV